MTTQDDYKASYIIAAFCLWLIIWGSLWAFIAVQMGKPILEWEYFKWILPLSAISAYCLGKPE